MVDVLIVIAIGVSLCYSILLLYFSKSRANGTATQKIDALTVLIPFKNDAENLRVLLGQLTQMNLARIDVTVICVNDHSSDNWKTTTGKGDLNLEILDLPSHLHGKKAAVNFGMSQARTSWVLTLDADVALTDNFFATIQHGVSEKAKYCLLPITATRTPGFVRAFFDLEFLALHFIGLKSAQTGKPLLSNAACSLINKDAYLSTVSNRSDWNIPSGDDVFAMFAIAEKYGSRSIQTIESHLTVMAKVDFPKRFAQLWKQRLRWIGKSASVKNTWFSMVSILTLGFNLIFIFALIVTFVESTPSWFLALAVLQVLVQSVFLIRVVITLERNDLLKWILPSAFIYPFYLLTLVIVQIFWKPNWK